MAELLTIISPNATNREAGDVCVVKEDGWPWSELERKLFVVVRVPMTVEEAEEKYLKSGMPPEVETAYREARDYHRSLPEGKEKEAAKEDMLAKQFNPTNYNHRGSKLDITALPSTVVESAVNTKLSLDSAQPLAKEAARSAVEAELIKIDGELLPENEELHTIQLVEVYERGAGDNEIKTGIKDTLLAASREGSMTVIQPILDAIDTPPVVEITKEDLLAVTIDKKI